MTKTRLRLLAMTLLFSISAFAAAGSTAEENKSQTAEAIEKRQMVELKSFFLKDPKSATLPKTNLAIQFYNQAVEHMGRNEYVLARQALQDSLAQDETNALAYELLGDIDYLEQNLKEAKSNYEIAYALSPSENLKTKIEKLRNETVVEKKLATYREYHFLIKYHGEEKTFEGFELRELLRQTYLNISRDFAHYFNHQIVVLLYDEEEFKELVNVPHWAGGVYDGKIRMPAYKKGFGSEELAALTAHEATHAFVAAMSGGRAPAWINEGLAEVEEHKVNNAPTASFNSALKKNTLMPLDQLISQSATSTLTDPTLFYEQSFRFTGYLIERYGMFRVKQLLEQFKKGKNSDEAIREIFKISTRQLEKEWKETLLK